MTDKTIETIVDKYPYCYIGEYDGYYDLVIEIFDKKELEEHINKFIHHYKNVYGIMAYYDEYSLDEIEQLMNKEVEGERERLIIYDRNSDKEVFNNVINKYRNVDLDKDNLIEDYLIDIFPYIPFTHMAILIDDQYLRLVNYKGSLQIDEIQDIQFKSWLKLDGVKYKNRQIHIVYANENEEISITPTLLYKLNKVNTILNNLAIIELDKVEIKESEIRYANLEELHQSLSYEVNDDFIITHASKRLIEKYSNNLIGSYCYEKFYDRESPCKTCPLRSEENKAYMVSSKLYERVVDIKGIKNTIYLTTNKATFINDRKTLDNVLLGLINSNEKGYLLVFKLDALPQLASRNKVGVEQIVKSIIERLETYGLNDNLYRKEEDEFVYILKYASVADAIRLAKAVSKAFLESFGVEDKNFEFLPKVIMLSYPLEVNTLFSLDSLSKTLFNSVTKKGMLYRVAEEPTPIDDHRHYMEIVEESFKNNEVPVNYHKIKDLQNKEKLSFVGYHYLDENHNHIPDDMISLYVKIDKKYVTFMDKFVRSFNFEDEGQRYVTSIGKEGLDKKLFDTLIGFFNSKKIKPERVIFECKEKDLYNHIDAANYAMDLGFIFAVDINDSGSHNLDLSKYEYIRLDGPKLESDRAYQNKINSLIHGQKPILIDDKHKDLILGARFTY